MTARTVLEPDGLDDVQGYDVVEPVRFSFVSPLRGGPPLAEIRRALALKGRLRFSGTPARLFADVDPGPVEPAVLALDMIARSDAEGLERAILSALPYVDEIVIGMDGRSDSATWDVARAYADVVHYFEARDIGLTDEEWKADAIHFANARNLGRSKVKAPWTLQIDSDEFVRRGVDLREILREAELFAAIEINLVVDGATNKNCHRLARTAFRWWSRSHNQLDVMGTAVPQGEAPLLEVVQDTSLRAEAEIDRRRLQRDGGIEALREEAEKGQVIALYHLAKHVLFYGDIEDGVRLAERYRTLMEVDGPFADNRAQLAMRAAFAYYKREDFLRAKMWAVRVLLDGPRPEALCMLGDIAEDLGQLETALTWYELACVTPVVGNTQWQYIDRREGRRDGLRLALGKVPGVPAMSRAELDRVAGREPQGMPAPAVQS